LWVVVLCVIPVLVASFQLRQIATAIGAIDFRPDRPNTVIAQGFTLLIVGVDSRNDGSNTSVRSDSLMLARIQPYTGNVSLLSIPRDSRVSIRGRGESKINAAYAHGYMNPQSLYTDDVSQQEAGMALVAETVEDFLMLRSRGYRVDYVLELNFTGFAQLIDAFGGIDVDVPTYLVDAAYPTADYGVMRIEFQPGLQRMTGEQALIYARTRHADSDFGRIQRQQQVAQAFIAAIKRADIARWWYVANNAPQIMGGSVRTTMPLLNPLMVTALIGTMVQVDATTMASTHISPKTIPRYTVDGSDLLWDTTGVQAVVDTWLTQAGVAIDATQLTVQADVLAQSRQAVTDTWRSITNYVRSQAGWEIDEGAARVQVFNGSRIPGMARSVSEQLHEVGIVTDAPGDAPGDVHTETIIYDLNNHPKQAASIALLIPGKVVTDKLPAPLQSTADIVIVLGTDIQP
jgi:LCP family protein required for cell wall assembly